MKKILLLAVLFAAFIFTSCSDDDCMQDALSEKITEGASRTAARGFINVCHNNETITIAIEALETHLGHGDTEGDCPTLHDGGLHFDDGEIVEIDCSYELPFIHTKANGEQWYFSSPK